MKRILELSDINHYALDKETEYHSFMKREQNFPGGF